MNKLPEFNNNGKVYRAATAPHASKHMKEYLAECQKRQYYRAISPISKEPFGPAFWFVSDCQDWVKDTFGSAVDAPHDKQIPLIEIFPVPPSSA